MHVSPVTADVVLKRSLYIVSDSSIEKDAVFVMQFSVGMIQKSRRVISYFTAHKHMKDHFIL